MTPSDASAVVHLVQTIAQIDRGDVVTRKGQDASDLRHEACQRFRDHVREETPVDESDFKREDETDYKTLYNVLAERVREMQRMVIPTPRRMGQFEPSGIDFNGLVHYINNTIAVKL